MVGMTPKRSINKKRRKALGILMLFLLALAVGAVSFSLLLGINPISPFLFSSASMGEEPINILLLGADAGDGHTRTDTMIVVSIDPKTKDVNMLSIPRDTKVKIQGQTHKINAAHAIGGSDLAVEEIESLLNVSIPYYIKVDFQGFKHLVDLVGGVEINVDKRLRYTDRAGETYINIPAGLQRLDGQQALNYARFRHDALGDLGRVKRQQVFMQALLHELLKPEQIFKWPAMIRESGNYLETNLNVSELSSLAAKAKLSDREIKVVTIPGVPQYMQGISYFIPDTLRLKQLVQTEILREDSALDPAFVRVEILNGSGITGLAQTLAKELTQKGFLVVKVDNADSFNYEQTQIFSRTGKTFLAQEISRLVGKGSFREVDKDSSDADITIIIGKNFKRL